MDAEDSLVRRSLHGDHQAFTRLIEMHQQVAHRVATGMVGSGGGADDVVQDAFVKAFTRLGQLDPDRSFRPWLLAIVANEARNRHRSGARYDAMTLRVAARADVRAAPWTDPEAAHAHAERQQSLARAVASLSARDREIIALRYFAELSEAEAAQALGCPPGTVKSRLHRALERLRAVIDDVEGEDR